LDSTCLVCIIMVVVIVVIAIYVSFNSAQQEKREERRKESVVKQNQTASSGSRNHVEFIMPLSEKDAQFRTATFDDENVYFERKNTEPWRIASYKRFSGGEAECVFLDVAGREIGLIYHDHPNIVWLSRFAIYDNFLREEKELRSRGIDYKAKYPNPMHRVAWEIVDNGGRGLVYDYETEKLIGRYTGNKIGAACAFCALSFELHSDTEYHQFTHGWVK